MKNIETTNAPKALGPYSQGIVIDNFCFVSMQLGINPTTGKIDSEGTAEQTRRVIKNVEAILSEGGFNLKDVVKATLYITDLNDFQTINDIYAKYFTHKPARSLVVQAGMPAGAKVALDVIAYKREEDAENLEYATR